MIIPLSPILETSLDIAILIVGIACVLSLIRLVIGPNIPDRILALDTLYVNTIALVILFGLTQSSMLYFEAALLIAVMGFIGTIALSKYLARGDIME
jgi:multicomponent K+:H+ antiporter subunit F